MGIYHQRRAQVGYNPSTLHYQRGWIHPTYFYTHLKQSKISGGGGKKAHPYLSQGVLKNILDTSLTFECFGGLRGWWYQLPNTKNTPYLLYVIHPLKLTSP